MIYVLYAMQVALDLQSFVVKIIPIWIPAALSSDLQQRHIQNAVLEREPGSPAVQMSFPALTPWNPVLLRPWQRLPRLIKTPRRWQREAEAWALFLFAASCECGKFNEKVANMIQSRELSREWF